MNSLHELLVDELKDLWSAETQLTKALPKLQKAAHSQALKEALQEHLEVTKNQLNRVERIFKTLETSPRGKKCAAMEGLINEGQEIIKEKGDGAVIDAALIAAAQRVEHYEIAAYGSAIAHAKLLGLPDMAKALHETLEEEKQADEELTKLARDEVNPAALSASAEA
jgi:ferritin-like metal-binding protein YciE